MKRMHGLEAPPIEARKAPRAFVPCVVAGMLAISTIGARAAPQGVHEAQAPGTATSIGCRETEYRQAFSNRDGAVMEAFCGMEIRYSEGKGGRTVRFDAPAMDRRGAVRDLLVGREFSVVLTENFAIVAPGTESEWNGSVAITLPENLKGRPASFNPNSNILYVLSQENEIYLIDVRGGGWMRARP